MVALLECFVSFTRRAQVVPSCATQDVPSGAPGSSTQALEEAFRDQRGELTRYFRRAVDPHAAADMVQEVFCRAVGSPQAHQLDNPAGFLRRIARNLLIDRVRRSRRTGDHVPFEEACDAPSPPTQEHALEADDLLRLYESAVAQLPEKTRRVFLLHRVEERSYREIHELLGISVATVEYHMMKALAHLIHAIEGSR